MTHSIGSPGFWIAFVLVVVFLLAVDLGVFNRKAHKIGVREALAWCSVWVTLSILFGCGVYMKFGSQKGLEFFAGYLIEYALSVDNIFVFILIFSYFAVPENLHHRVLFWGILVALVTRAAFILAGTALILTFHWIIYVFGGFLIFTGFKILRHGDTKVDPARNPVVRLFQRVLPVLTSYEGSRFFVRRDSRLLATPLAIVLVAVETTDVVFAVDSIPAIFAVSYDPFVVFTSNICAILGLRSMYFLLAAFVGRFVYLYIGLGIVLAFVGVKMLISDISKIPISISLALVALILLASVLISLLRPPKPPRPSGEASIPGTPLVSSPPDKA